MRTILTIGYHHFLLPKDANVSAILKALSSAIEVRQCLSTDPEKKDYRHAHEKSGTVEMKMVDDKAVGPALPNVNDYGEEQVEAEPVEDGPKLLKMGRLQIGNGGER